MTDKEFENRIKEDKKDFDKSCDLYRSYVCEAETWEERKRRINRFRCG